MDCVLICTSKLECHKLFDLKIFIFIEYYIDMRSKLNKNRFWTLFHFSRVHLVKWIAPVLLQRMFTLRRVIQLQCNNLFFGSIFLNSAISLHISWSLLNFCFKWCLAHVSHSGSGSSHVLQKWLALTLTLSVEQGSQSNLSDPLSLKQ